MLLYLIHYNNPEKEQYDVDEVDGELSQDLINLIQSRNESAEEKLQRIMNKIENESPSLTEITKFCMKNNYYNVLKQNQYLIQRLIEENRRYRK